MRPIIIKGTFSSKVVIAGLIPNKERAISVIPVMPPSAKSLGILKKITVKPKIAVPSKIKIKSLIVFKEKMSKTNLVSAAAILFGVFLTLRMGEGGGHYIEGFAYGMASSLTYALLSLVNRRLSAHYPGVKVCFYQQLTVVLLLLFAAAPTVKMWQPGDYISIAAIGALCTAFAFSLFVEGQNM